MATRLFVVQTNADLEKCYPILKELRPRLTFDECLAIYKQSHDSDGYRIVAIENASQVLAVMGYRFLSDFVRGKHVYIDDLVATEKARSQGLGAELLRYAEGIAATTGCKSLRLCTGIENKRGMKFYEKNGWTKRSFAYTKKCL